MTECVECEDDFRLEDGYEDDGMCHACAHAIAEGQNSRMVSERDLTIRDLRAREEQGARIRQQIEDTLRAADTRATQAEARAERYREALEDAEDALGVALNDWHRTHTMADDMRQHVQNAYASVSAALAADGT